MPSSWLSCFTSSSPLGLDVAIMGPGALYALSGFLSASGMGDLARLWRDEPGGYVGRGTQIASGRGVGARISTGLSLLSPSKGPLKGCAGSSIHQVADPNGDDMTAATAVPQRPRRRPDLDVRVLEHGNAIVTSDGSAHLSLNPHEHGLLVALDGRRTAAQLHDGWDDDIDDIDDILTDFAAAGLLEGTAPEPGPRVSFSQAGIEFLGLGRIVDVIHRLGGHLLFRRPVVAALAAVAAVGLALTISNTVDTSGSWLHFGGPVVILWLIAADLVASVLHETTHAIVVRHYGRRVGRAGFGFHWGALSFFVDSTDALLLPRKERVIQALAGPAADAVIAGMLSVTTTLLGSSSPWAGLLYLIAVRLWIDVALNLSPVLDLDGYWALADALDRPQLRSESLHAISHLARGDAAPVNLALACYGLLSVLFGLASIGVSIWLWTTIYAEMVFSTWSAGLTGRFAVVAFVAPLLLGTIASVAGTAVASLRTRRIPNH